MYQLTNPEGIKALGDDLRSLVGAAVFDAYDNLENGRILKEAFGDEISLSEAQRIFNQYRLTNRIVSTEYGEATVEAEEVEIPQTVAQEHELFFARKSASEIRARMKVDQAFGAYARTQMGNELIQAEDGVGERLQLPANMAEASLREAHPALKKFAKQYTNTPAEKLRRPVAGVITMHDGTTFDWPKFQLLVSQASAAGLL